uniref:Uncharacterized protein n=1 Tax=Ammopiptanthus mongolicus TaxID=126911 RepID=A0A4P8PNW7_AMMMO|nr:hypothetical protein [Ammopiptanthus mongolicus]
MVELLTSLPLNRISFSAPSLIQQSGAHLPGKGREIGRIPPLTYLKKSLSPPLSLSLASTFTYLLASVVDFAPSAPELNKQFSGCSLLNEAIGTAALIALSQ